MTDQNSGASINRDSIIMFAGPVLGLLLAIGCWQAYTLTAPILSNRRSPLVVSHVLHSPPSSVTGKRSSYLGPADASNTLVVFSDFQCPVCITKDKELPGIVRSYGTKLRIVFRHLPLKQHRDAKAAAQVAAAAGQQGKFVQMHDALFRQNGQLDFVSISRIVRELHLDRTRFDKDFDTSAKNEVEQDLQTADEIGVPGTPTFVLCKSDGTVVMLASLESLGEYLKP